MMSTLRSVFRWSLLVLVILVLSHIVEIRGVSLSQHVLNGMRAVADFTPARIYRNLADQISGKYARIAEERLKPADHPESPSREDQAELDRVIERSQARK